MQRVFVAAATDDDATRVRDSRYHTLLLDSRQADRHTLRGRLSAAAVAHSGVRETI